MVHVPKQAGSIRSSHYKMRNSQSAQSAPKKGKARENHSPQFVFHLEQLQLFTDRTLAPNLLTSHAKWTGDPLAVPGAEIAEGAAFLAKKGFRRNSTARQMLNSLSNCPNESFKLSSIIPELPFTSPQSEPRPAALGIRKSICTLHSSPRSGQRSTHSLRPPQPLDHKKDLTTAGRVNKIVIPFDSLSQPQFHLGIEAGVPNRPANPRIRKGVRVRMVEGLHDSSCRSFSSHRLMHGPVHGYMTSALHLAHPASWFPVQPARLGKTLQQSDGLPLETPSFPWYLRLPPPQISPFS